MENDKIEMLLQKMGSQQIPPDVENIAERQFSKFTDKLKERKHINFREYFMRTKLIQIGAAAVIIIAVIVGINYFAGPLSIASVGWADVVAQMSKYTKYKYREKVVREQGPQNPTMIVYHLNLSQRRQKVENGDIHIIDMRGEDAVTLELKPDEKKAIITKLVGFGPKKDPDIIDMVKRFERETTERLGTKKLGGKILQGFRHKPNEYNDFTVWVDSKTKLPVEIEIKHPKIGQTIFMDEFEFNFDLDESAFSTSVPDDYDVETIVLDYRTVEPKEIAPENICSKLNHAAYAVEKLPWIKKVVTIETLDPLGSRIKVYMTGIQSDDENMIILAQGNYYDANRMIWVPKQQLVLETLGGVKLYTHPNGSTYAQSFLENFAKAKPEFFDTKDLSEERFTVMVMMPDETILSLSANKQMSNQKLQELIKSLTEIKPNE